MFKVLFVDDEVAILEITKLLLSSLGFEAFVANSGKMAIEILADKAKRQQIQIIFLDLTMPEISGLEVLEWINKNNVKIPTILQTGIKDKKEIEKATILGIKDYMIKPYTKEQLYQFIVKYAKNKMILGIKNSN
jgi:CheY-like chemotaxis protein